LGSGFNVSKLIKSCAQDSRDGEEERKLGGIFSFPPQEQSPSDSKSRARKTRDQGESLQNTDKERVKNIVFLLFSSQLGKKKKASGEKQGHSDGS